MAPDPAQPASLRLLVGHLHRAGIKDATPEMVERWYLAGLIPSPRKRQRRKGRGTTSRFPPGTAAQARELHAILSRYRSFHKAALVLFLRGYPVSERALKDALSALLGGMFGGLDPSERRSAERWADGVSKRRLTSPDEHARRKEEIKRVGGCDAYQAHLVSIVRPLVGKVDAEALADTLGIFGILEAARVFAVLAPDFISAVEEEARAGRLSPLYLLETSIPRLTLAHFDLLARFLAVAMSWLEREHDFTVQHSDPFIADWLDALRHPRWRWKPVEIPHTTEEERP